MEKTAKYSKRWVRRWVVLKGDLTLLYGLDDKTPAKHQYNLVKMTRGAEQKKDPLSFVLDCEDASYKAVDPPVILKAENRQDFDKWHKRFIDCLVGNGQLENPDEGLPATHPKTHLEFVPIPLELLHTFAPLDRLCLHFFAVVDQRMDTATGLAAKFNKGGTYEKQCVFIGDRLLYTCKMDANITRCINMKDVYRIMTVQPGADGDLLHVGVQCAVPEHDILFKISKAEGDDFIKKLQAVHAEHSGSRKKLPEEKVDRLELLVPQLALSPNEFFKLSITLPMSKKYLKKAMQQWVSGGLKGGGDAEEKKKVNPMNASSPLLGGKPAEVAGPASPLVGLGSRSKPAAEPSSEIQSPKVTGGSGGGAAKAGGAGDLRIVGSPQSKADQTGKIMIPPGIDKMHRLLLYVGLPQYYQVMTERGVDWEVFMCMNQNDLKSKGVTEVKHQQIIENALNSKGVMEAIKEDPPAAPAPPSKHSDDKDKKKPAEAPSKNGPPAGTKPNTPKEEETTKPLKTVDTAINGPSSKSNPAVTVEFDDEDL